MSNKVLVTGGAGFIGSHLVEALLDRGDHVTVLDNLSTGKKENLPEHENLKLVLGDVQSRTDVATALAGCDVVFHLAAMVSVEESILQPYVCDEINVNGTLNLLEEVRRKSVQHFVYASSTAVYGEVNTLPVSETAPTNPLSPYALSKLTAEKYAILYHGLYSVPSVALRFFNVYGPRQSTGHYGVITNFLTEIEDGKPLTVFGDGKQTRDFVHVSDVVSACVAVTKKKDVIGQIVNIGTGQETSIKKLARQMIKMSGRKLAIKHAPPRKGEIRFSRADISKAKSLIGYNPKLTVDDGLRKLLRLRGLVPK